MRRKAVCTVAVLVMAWLGMTVEAQTCVSGRNAGIPFFGNANPDPSLNSPNVTIYTDAEGRNSASLQSGLAAASSKWNAKCPRSSYNSVPSFAVNTTQDRPGSGAEAERRGIQIDFIDEPAPVTSPGPPPDVSMAAWNPQGNIIKVYRRCPANGVQVAEVGCTGGSNQLINWGSAYGQLALAHEIGHALGLEHDRATSAGGQTCGRGLMNAKPQLGDDLLDDYCSFLDRALNDRHRCNSESPTSTEGNPCEVAGRLPRNGERPTDGIGNEFCEMYPWLCDDGPTSWAGGSPLCNWFCVSFLNESHCEWGCSAPPVVLAPRSETEGAIESHYAPTMALTQPAEGATVSGIITIAGHAHEFFHSPALAFGVDGVELPVSDLIRSIATPNVIWHPNRNDFVGFSAKLDTRRVANGTHTLQVTATDIYGFPTKLERTITTNNTCFDYTPPSVGITVPAPATGVITVTSNASDDKGVTKIDFYVDGVYKATDNAAPFSYSWDTNLYSAGNHTVEARAHDGCSNISVASKVVTVTKPAHAAQFVSQSAIPASLTPGQQVTISVTMKNTGTATWTAVQNFRLGSQSPQDNMSWGFNRVHLAAGDAIAWNQQKTFTFTITAPQTAGTYAVQWRMLKEAVEWFGDFSTKVNVTVAPPTGPGYQGCYTDDPMRALPVQLGGTTHTIESCRAAAGAAGYAYAGLQYYGYCFAGNSLGYVKVADSDCNTPCTSNNSQMCGGAWRNSIYTSTVPLYRGYHDSFDCETVQGWACDANSASPINVDIYDGATYLGSVTANQQREAAVGASCGGYAARGFTYTLPASVRNGATHAISVRFPNSASLNGSPRSAYCEAPEPAGASIAWIQPAEATWGPAGTLTAAGYATNGTGTVQLRWRERGDNGVWGAWNTVGFQATPDASGQWSNTISSGNPTNKCHHFDAYVIYSGLVSPTYHYYGWTGCP